MAFSKFSLAFLPSMYSYFLFITSKLCACLLSYRRALDALQSDRQVALQGLRSDLHQLIDAIRDQQAANREQQQTQQFESNLPERIIRAEREINEYAQREERTYRKLELWAQYALVVGTWLAFIAAAIYAGVAAYQLREMTRAADSSSKTADIALNALKENKRQFDETLIQMQAQTAEQGRAASAAQTQADNSQKALGAAIDNFHLEQRAWVVPAFTTDAAHFQVNNPIPFPLTFVNSGRTAAKKFQGLLVTCIMNRGDALTFDYTMRRCPPLWTEVGLLFPNNPQHYTFDVLDKNVKAVIIDDALHKRLEAGESYAVLYGKITYNDIYGVGHWVTFCQTAGKTLQDLSGYRKCAQYNDTGDGDGPK